MKNLILLIFIVILGNCSKKPKLEFSKQEKEGNLSETVSYKLGKDYLTLSHIPSKKNFFRISLKKPFLEGTVVETKVDYKMASFEFEENVKEKCSNQKITSIEEKPVFGAAKPTNQLLLKGSLTGENCNTSFLLSFTPTAEKSLGFSANLYGENLNQITFRYASSSTEQFFGFGEQFSHFNFKGKRFPLFTEEQGIGRGDQPITFGANLTAGAGGNEFTTYTPIPHYITTENRSVFFENSSYSIFDLQDPTEVSVSFKEKSLSGTAWVAESPLDLIELYTEKTGRFPGLPDWAYGTWMGLQAGKEATLKHIQEARVAGNPVTALWIQDWVGRRKTSFGSQLWWRWEADETSYPDFLNFTQSLEKEGIVVLGYINSFLANEGKMFEEAKAKGYLVKTADGKDYEIATAGFPAYLVDLTNPEARIWMKNIIKNNMMGKGLKGWMADFGEWLPYDARLKSEEPASLHHNRYPVEWARLNREAIQEAGKEGEIVFFTRAGYSYSNRYSTLFWLGDQMVSFGMNDGLASTIVGLNSGGISGIALNHSDIGGYTTINNPIRNYHRSKELFFRWTELNAFTLIYRTHEGNRPEKNHQPYSDKETIEFFAKFGKVHFALKDYLKFLVEEAKTKGYPVVRHPYLHYPSDPNTHELKYQYMLGKDMLVLPVYKQGGTSVSGYFPEGKWINIWTGKIQEGKKRAFVSAPIGKPAVYVKEGGEWSEKILSSIKKALE
ncbi:MAG: alpha-glucosidase [Leptospiraceae bacterium]|nr:alpha-glucosidase [Leptospiraceae bacterium]